MYSFNYHTPTDLDEALKIYENSDDPKYLAGGMTLIDSMKQRLASPSDLIDLTKIDSDLKIPRFKKGGIFNKFRKVA